jgi:hypothetical protein
MSIKSITTVNTTHGWAVRQRHHDGSELFVIAEGPHRYTLHEAQAAESALRHAIANHGESYAAPLPSGVRAVKS